MTEKHKDLEGVEGYDLLFSGLESAGLSDHIKNLHQMGDFFLSQINATKDREGLLIERVNERLTEYEAECQKVVSLMNSEIITLKQQDRKRIEAERENRTLRKSVESLTQKLENAEWLHSYNNRHVTEEEAVAQEMTNPSEKVSPRKSSSSTSSTSSYETSEES
jgi:valyl-tRNA synthetase